MSEDPPEESEVVAPEAAKQEADSDLEKKRELEKAEQMARYEESLKDSDWGHQPC